MNKKIVLSLISLTILTLSIFLYNQTKEPSTLYFMRQGEKSVKLLESTKETGCRAGQWDCYTDKMKKQKIDFANDLSVLNSGIDQFAILEKKATPSCDQLCEKKIWLHLQMAVLELVGMINIDHYYAYQQTMETVQRTQYTRLYEDAITLSYLSNRLQTFIDESQRFRDENDSEIDALKERFESIIYIPIKQHTLTANLSYREIQTILDSQSSEERNAKQEELHHMLLSYKSSI